jgi:hypothetical protein
MAFRRPAALDKPFLVLEPLEWFQTHLQPFEASPARAIFQLAPTRQQEHQSGSCLMT